MLGITKDDIAAMFRKIETGRTVPSLKYQVKREA